MHDAVRRGRGLVLLLLATLLTGCLALPQTGLFAFRLAVTSLGIEDVRIGPYSVNAGLDTSDLSSLLASSLGTGSLPVQATLAMGLGLPAGMPPVEMSGFRWTLDMPGVDPMQGNYAVAASGTFFPLRVGTLQQVINETEHCAAHFGAPVEHDLNQQVDIIVHTYQKVADRWLWTGQELKSFSDADEAYLHLRKLEYVIDHLELQVEAANVKRAYTCSHNCNRPWLTILHRLQFSGELPEGGQPGECPRCFSHFVQLLEGGEFCLNCGYEQTRD